MRSFQVFASQFCSFGLSFAWRPHERWRPNRYLKERFGHTESECRRGELGETGSAYRAALASS